MKNDYEELKNLPPDVIDKVMKAVKEIEKNQNGADEYPLWWDGKQLDEIAFCEWFANKHELMYVGSQFFDIDGFRKRSWRILSLISNRTSQTASEGLWMYSN